ncbi:hypothetical protein NW754_001629 [Fusarium falciforme]|nr:hypothetical protein NW754_001629 [Fusarium falciforme]
MDLSFTTLDVFTKTPFRGNPLAVVTIPPPSQRPPLTQAQKQAIAREFNLSETVFVHDVDASSASSERVINIFTPDRELPFAGHPTIGTAVFLKSQGVETLIAKAGRIECQFGQDGSARAAIPHNVRLHQQQLSRAEYTGSDEKLAQLAAAEEGARLFTSGAAKIGAMGYLSGDLQDEGWRTDFDSRRYYFVLTGHETAPDGNTFVQKVRTRLVKREMEDPATGSAACALSCYLALHVLSADSVRVEITQGVEMGRESLIVVDVEVQVLPSGEREVKTVHLSGTAVEVMSGVIKAKLIDLD